MRSQIGSHAWCKKIAKTIVLNELKYSDHEGRTVKDYKKLFDVYDDFTMEGLDNKLRFHIKGFIYGYMQRHVDKRKSEGMSIEDILNR